MQPSQENTKTSSFHQDSPHQIGSEGKSGSGLDTKKYLEVSSPYKDCISQQRPFAPFVAKTLQILEDTGFYNHSISYNEKYNMIIACPCDNSLRFFDATTLLPIEGRKTEKLDSPVRHMAFEPETETFLLSCDSGDIYSYGVSKQILKMIRRDTYSMFTKTEFIGSKYYAFPKQLQIICIGNLEDESLICLEYNQRSLSSMKNLQKKNLLLVSFLCGSLRIYRTDRLPKLPMLFSVGRDKHMATREIHHPTINGKEYIVTPGCDCKIRIWHLTKGKLRLLRVISMKEQVFCVVYLENYQMLAVTHMEDFISFFSLPSGKFVRKLDLNLENCRGIFLMKDKNMIGVSSYVESDIKIIQLDQRGSEE